MKEIGAHPLLHRQRQIWQPNETTRTSHKQNHLIQSTNCSRFTASKVEGNIKIKETTDTNSQPCQTKEMHCSK
ncbi:hypothetical protein SDJN02_02606 [Cucurbita argyrosperma subsp. argyrosperma]|nr:hypothetical protein SDJN02_02606 [Cucurbita argyrosperma subsp. argyrosperma]